MNPLIQQAAGSIGLGWLATIMTVLFLTAFLAWVWYACTPRNRQKFEDASRMPFEEGVDT
ncbi:MAG: cbb3-type cytochrome c oxidase subunit 3 [Candidatus Palauibacterales bacterium]|jgi:cbb3-type cytochrome oxidase subunit 3|nr:cbb3-type cytochrome c oxidase subunit 3 [Candidatus Palauibacterales bacterium]MDP2482559.1 cbb3-type cytochrome c oxidase subunit 3 [Candidatus Palauibacterales bacterium]